MNLKLKRQNTRSGLAFFASRAAKLTFPFLSLKEKVVQK